MRLALVLEIATTLGGLAGGVVAVLIAPSLLDGLFAAVMLVTAFLVFRGREEGGEEVSEESGAAAPASSRSTWTTATWRRSWRSRGR